MSCEKKECFLNLISYSACLLCGRDTESTFNTDDVYMLVINTLQSAGFSTIFHMALCQDRP